MNFILKFFRKLYFLNKNDIKPQTLICNNCLAGCVLHDYNMRFDTPTINRPKGDCPWRADAAA